MAATIKGKQISWGLSAGAITAATGATTAGIAQSFSISRGGVSTTINDEDDDIVTRIDHAAENKISIEVMALSTSTVPAKGTELTITGTFDGLSFSSGRTFVDDAKVDYANAQAKKITISATHYPIMAADA